MHYFIFASKDSYITEDSSGQVILYPDSTDRNYGADEIIELKKEFVNSYSTTPYNVSRMLTQFDYSDISASIVDGYITSPKFYLRYYEVEGQSELNKTYSLSSFPISQSWEEGVGKHFDNPKTTGGVTWESGSSVWTGGIFHSDRTLGSELISDGGFDVNVGSSTTGDHWTTSAGWTIAGGVATHVNSNINQLRQLGVLVVGKTYKVQFDIASRTAGSVTVDDDVTISSPARSVVGTYTHYLTAANTFFDITPTSDFAGTIDNVSIKEVLGGGSYISSSGACSQSFTNQSGDIEMDVTDIVNNHLGGANKIDNYGFITKFSGSYEDDGTPLNLKFFSKNTHTIYAPKLEVRWDDSTYSYTGTFEDYEEEFNQAYGSFGDPQIPLTELTMSGEVKNHIFIKGLQPAYRESEKVRFRIGCRKKYVQKTFTESVYTSSFHVPVGSGSYSIIDIATETPVVPFGEYTKLSADLTSMYFDQWLNTFESGRYYKVLFKLKYNDGQEIIYDNDEEFKVI